VDYTSRIGYRGKVGYSVGFMAGKVKAGVLIVLVLVLVLVLILAKSFLRR
jgi:hypothetical protein